MRAPAIAAGGIAAAIAAALMLSTGPRDISVASEHTGDAEISAALEYLAEDGHHNLAAFTFEDGEARFGGLGADEHTEFEIGSITKTFNAELVRQFIDAGELSLDTQVQELIDVPSVPVADVTIEELLNHTSGLAATEGLSLADMFAANIRDGGNPYRRDTPQDILDAAGAAELNNRGQEQYSNYGHALLGQLLAKHAGVPYHELLRTRIFEPAGMTSTYVALPGTVDDAPPGLAANGHPAGPWDMDGWAPAGAIRSTAADMAKYVAWVSSHGVPDYGWASLEENGEEITFHNGGTGGFRTMLVWDPEDDSHAAFVAGDTEAWVDALGIDLLKETR
ncbi:serine hydrolase domain-containing protein [Corynebacterium fournieri]|uniref:serine hydrolase domain-containing protein n=1 Tax=Corynebacterium fournieri TaxID=1852390 RepID=UPI000A2EDBCF|nr:serine hydrolase domain-containing protein [Corynebacterium fournieri]WJY97399.1 Penicillin-binding protein 4* [Corynebacterium fournieri]